jgi:hypothetical protein
MKDKHMLLASKSDTAMRSRETFDTLMAKALEPRPPADQWLYLEAAHVIGQLGLRTHTLSHWYMLKLSIRTSDWKEARGQLFRLFLVPLGHLTGRLPMGNPGRATVSAFATIPVRQDLRQLIASARGPQSQSQPRER